MPVRESSVLDRTLRRNNFTLFYLLSETERCFILIYLLDSLCYILLWLTIDTRLLFDYFENTTVFMSVLSRSFVVFTRHIVTVGPLKACLKPVSGAKKVGELWSGEPQLARQRRANVHQHT